MSVSYGKQRVFCESQVISSRGYEKEGLLLNEEGKRC